MNRIEKHNDILITPDAKFKFTAQWITLPENDGKPNIYFRAYKSFELEKVPKKALLRICADSYYLLFINGRKVQFGPVRGTCAVNYFDTLDVTQFLQQGENKIGVIVHSPVTETFIAAPAEPAFILELPGVVASDATWMVQLAGDWKREVEIYTIQTDYIEYRDFRLEPVGWLNGELDGAWNRAKPVGRSSKLLQRKLTARNVPAMSEWIYRPVDILQWHEVEPVLEGDTEIAMQINNDVLLPMNAQRLQEAAPGEYILNPDMAGRGISLIADFGCDLIGNLEVKIVAPAGTIVDVTYSEEIWQEKGDRLRGHYNNAYHVTDRYLLKEGENIIGTQLSERGFRMVQLTVRDFQIPVRIQEIKATGGEYPYDKRGSFECSDELLNRIWEVCARTLEVCTTDVFMDCPWRERAFWVNDLVVENATTLAAFGASAVHKRAFELAFSQQRDDGFVSGVCPAPKQGNVLVPTNLFLVTMLYDYLMMSGDSATVKTYLPNVQRILELFESLADEKGIVTAPHCYGVATDHWNFYDWGFELNGYNFRNCRESMLNHLYVTAMKNYCALCDYCGSECDRELYRKRIARTAAAIGKEFIEPATGYLSDQVMHHEKPEMISSQLSHAFAVLSGEVGESFKKAVTDHNLICPEYYLHFFVFRAMQRIGKEALADGLARIRKYWGRSVDTGYPTLYEAGIHKLGREAFCETGSLCHGFGTAPIEFFHRNILGVTPLEPGYARFEFKPELFDLEFASGRIPTPAGEIAVSCRKAEITLEIPKGLTAVYGSQELGAGKHLLKWR